MEKQIGLAETSIPETLVKCRARVSEKSRANVVSVSRLAMAADVGGFPDGEKCGRTASRTYEERLGNECRVVVLEESTLEIDEQVTDTSEGRFVICGGEVSILWLEKMLW